MTQKMLKINNFGPIGEGLTVNNGFIPFSKVMVFCGPQGAGKSSVAKLYSVFCWLEKALMRGDFNEKYLTKYKRFANNYCAYQNIQNYFKPETYLHFIGDAYEMIYEREKLSVKKLDKSLYLRPQIMYVPAERNILSVLEKAENVRGLPPSLNTLMDEFTKACRELKGDMLLPINDVSFKYDKLNKMSWVKSDAYSVRLQEASSGMQSLTPLFIVLQHLSKNIGVKDTSKSQKEREDIRKRIDELLKDDTLDAETRQLLISQIADNSSQYLLSIVEEPEQNLYPSSQRNILNFLLSVTSAKDNQLVITTHSPFILNYLALAIKAQQLLSQIDEKQKEVLAGIVPIPACVDGKEVGVFELTDDGHIYELAKYEEMPSDENMLNAHLSECNELFNQLLDLEESL